MPAAAYLQKAGLGVALVEQGPECAAFYRSYRIDGVLFDHSPVNFSCVSPAVADLDLASFGYETVFPDALYSALDGAGRGATFYPDPRTTAAGLAAYSEADARTFVRVATGIADRAAQLRSLVAFTPEPALDEATAVSAQALGIPDEELMRMNAPELVERLFESEPVRIFLMALPALNLFGDLLATGQGALAWLWTFLLRACVSPAGNGSLPRALEAAFVANGGVLHRRARVTRLHVEGGRCVGATVVSGDSEERLDARHAVVSNLGARLTGELLGCELAPDWSTSKRTVATADLVLRRPLLWADPAFSRAPRVYLLWESWERCIEWLVAAQAAEDEDVYFGHLELTQSHVHYGQRNGKVGLRARLGTGPYLDGDWDARRGRFRRRLEARLAELDAGFHEALVSLAVTTPADHWRDNPAACHGNPVGGDFVAGQWLGERPSYRTPIDALYLSNSVWPPSLSWMAPGYNAACVVAEELGVRRQPWWP